MPPFIRHPENPIFKPNVLNNWEALNVFNPGVIFHNGFFHMLYRAQGVDYISHIGYAISADGVHFNRLHDPVLSPDGADEGRGVEDPRITYLPNENRFIMTYTAFSRFGITPKLAESPNLISWRRIGPLVENETNKDHVLFPKKIKGRYFAFHRRPPSICYAFSDDLVTWELHGPIMKPRPDSWDCFYVGAGGVPIETDEGWLTIYHAYDQNHVYRLSACLLDLDEPWRVIHRADHFFLEPEEIWEIKGDVPNVVFTCANPVVGGIVYLYYGGADRVIGLATANVADVLDYTKHG